MLCEGNGTGALPQPPLAVNSGGGLTKKGGKGKTTCVSSSTALSLLFTSPSRSPPSPSTSASLLVLCCCQLPAPRLLVPSPTISTISGLALLRASWVLSRFNWYVSALNDTHNDPIPLVTRCDEDCAPCRTLTEPPRVFALVSASCLRFLEQAISSIRSIEHGMLEAHATIEKEEVT